ncbi:hypothetical protein L3X38_013096 [Prunus dulcis]|uniref:Agenet-like domain-containing protein n=1 Tax=Prunus dulcis TaxID=3755 RepID=A0AAD4ZGP8_PRUDU|nr:hypothetical protein L3X38_013096 [Prunus dulcis]
MQHTYLCFIFSDKEFVDLRDKARFRATIVTSPTNSASKKTKRALVEYKSLVTEDGSQQLKEYVDSAYLRPVPPPLGDQNSKTLRRVMWSMRIIKIVTTIPSTEWCLKTLQI